MLISLITFVKHSCSYILIGLVQTFSSFSFKTYFFTHFELHWKEGRWDCLRQIFLEISWENKLEIHWIRKSFLEF